MKRHRLGLVLVPAFLVLFVGGAAADMTAGRILERSIVPPPGFSMTAKAQVTQYLKRGKTHLFEWTIKRKVSKDTDKILFHVASGPSGEGGAFLSIHRLGTVGAVPERRLRKAGAKKTKRLDNDDARGLFAGTQFSFQDLDGRFGRFAVHRVLAKPVIDGAGCYLIESTIAPGKKRKAGKVRRWVRRDNFVLVKSELFDRKGRLIKSFRAGNIRREGDFWIARKWEAQGPRREKRTVLNFVDVKIGAELADDEFDPALLGGR